MTASMTLQVLVFSPIGRSRYRNCFHVSFGHRRAVPPMATSMCLESLSTNQTFGKEHINISMDLQRNRNPSQMSSPFRSKTTCSCGFHLAGGQGGRGHELGGLRDHTYLLPAQSFEMWCIPLKHGYFVKADGDAHIEYVTEIIILTCVVWCFFGANLNHNRIFNAGLDEQVCWVNMIKNCSMYWTKSNSWCQTIDLLQGFTCHLQELLLTY